MNTTIDITPIILSVISLLGAIITGFLVPLLKEKIGEAKYNQLMKMVTIAVESAEQLCRNGLIRKDERLDEVKKFLENNGYTVDTELINTMIESAVNKLPPLVIKS